MIPVPRREHKLLIAIHGWAGIVLGLLLLVIIATGTVAVLGEEIGQWSSGMLDARPPLTRPLDDNVKRVLAGLPIETFKEVDLSATAANRLTILVRGTPGPKEPGIAFEVGLDGRVLRRFEGLTDDVRDADPSGALSSFLVNLHIRLYVPAPWGFILTGIAGLAMLVAGISGLFIHRHLLRDIFTLRKGASDGLTERDRHSVAGSWSLPFVFLLAFTGSFLSLAGSVGVPLLAWVSFGGDQQKLAATLIGSPPAVRPTPTAGADLDGIVADAMRRAGTAPIFIRIANPGRADAHVSVFHETREGNLTRRTLDFDGVTGRFLGERPALGRRPSAGATAFSLMAPLHFGDFAGLASKLVWAALGFAACFVTLSGMRLWLARRDFSKGAHAAMDRAITVTAFGLPLAMATSAIAFFLSLSAGTTVHWTAVGFILGTASAIIAGALIRRPRLDFTLQGAAAIGLILLPLLRRACGGPSWGQAFAHGQVILVAGDVTMVLIGFAFGLPALRHWTGFGARRSAALLPMAGAE